MWLIKTSSIDQGTVCRGKLYHRRIEVLTKCICCKIDRSHIICRIYQRICSCFSRKIDSCPLAKAKYLLILRKNIASQTIGYLHHRIVAGIHKRLFKRFHSVSASVYTVNIMSSHVLISITVKTVTCWNFTCFKSRRYGKWFCSRSRLVSICSTEVLPDLIQSIHLCIFIHCINFFLRIICWKIPWITQVIIRIICHGKNISIIRIHDQYPDMTCSRLTLTEISSISFIKICNFLFHYRLDMRIYRGYDRVTVFCRLDGFFEIIIRI